MYLLFDIGGTKMRLAVSKDGKRLGKFKFAPTPKKFTEGIKLFKEIAGELLQGKKVKAVAGGIAGVLDQKKSKLFHSPNLKGWEGKPLKNKIQTGFKAPVFIENDTALIGLAEAKIGAGKDKNIVAYLTISTGIGGCRIVNGQIDQKAIGFEPGHQIVDAKNKFTDLEAQVSGSAFVKRYKKQPYEITDKKIWQQASKYLAYGIHNIIVLWSPDIVVLGGGMMKNPGIKIEEVKKQLKKTLKRFPQIPPIKKASLKDIGGLHGALYFLKQSRH